MTDAKIHQFRQMAAPIHRKALADKDSAAPLPSDGFRRSTYTRPLELKSKPTAQAPASKGSILSKVGLAAAGALTLAGVMGMASPAMAQSTSVTLQQAQDPVRVNFLQDVVNRFDADQQLYVSGTPTFNGQPISDAEMRGYQEVLAENPNVYLVMVDMNGEKMPVSEADYMLSRGVANSEEFLSVRNNELGKRDGVLFMMFFNVEGDPGWREVAMRSESLPDDLNVGEKQWAAEDGTPLELLNLFIANAKESGGPAGLRAVSQRINSTIEQHVRSQVDGPRQMTQQAQTALTELGPQLKQFQEQYGAGGTIGSPDVANWEKWSQQAQEALQANDFATAAELSTRVVEAVGQQQQLMTAYGTAFQAAPGLEAELNALRPGVERFDQFKDDFVEARDQFEAFETALEAKDPAFAELFESSRDSITSTSSGIKKSEEQAERTRKILIGSAVALGVAGAATALVLNMRARKKRKVAVAALDDAAKRITDRSKELLKLLDQSDYHDMANYEGKTKVVADALLDDVSDGLAMVGGAEMFLEESRNLIENGGLGNWFFTGKYDQAIGYLTDSEQKLAFSFLDSARKVIEEDSKANTWRDELQKSQGSRVFEKSLEEVLTVMADKTRSAEGRLHDIEEKSSKVVTYLDQVQGQASEVAKGYKELQEAAGESPYFTLEAGTEVLLPRVLGNAQEGGLVAQGRERSARNFVAAWDDYAKPAERLTQEAAQILEVGKEARSGLVPTLEAADAVLNPRGIETGWAHQQAEALSERLDDTANLAMRKGTEQELKALQADLGQLRSHISKVVQVDEQRVAAVEVIDKTEKMVAQARQEIVDSLHASGTFEGKEAGDVLRVEKRDPSGWIAEARQHLQGADNALDQGKTEPAQREIATSDELDKSVHQLIQVTREATGAIAGLSKHLAGPTEKAVKGADQALNPHQVETGWAHARYDELLKTLDRAAEVMMAKVPDQELQELNQAIAGFEQRIDSVQRIDVERRGAIDTVRGSEANVDQARNELFEKLQQAGAFAQGTGDQVLREPERDPSTRTEKANQHLAVIKERLDQGNPERPAGDFKAIGSLTKDADRLVAESRAAFEAYPGTLSERRGRHDSIKATIPMTYQGALKNLQQAYEPEVMQLVAPEVGAGETLSDNIEQAQTLLAQASGETEQAPPQFDQAQLLTARDTLSQSDRTLKSAQAQLDGITQATEVLAQHQKNTEKELSAMDVRFGETRTRSKDRWVRAQAKTRLQEAEGALSTARSAVQQEVKNPYTGRKKLGLAENSRTQVEQTIAADKQQYEAALKAIDDTTQEIGSTQGDIEKAGREKWHYDSPTGYGTASDNVTTADLRKANGTLAEANKGLGEVKKMVEKQEYEAAQTRAKTVIKTAKDASSQASSAIATARGRYETSLAQVKEKERLGAETERLISDAEGAIRSAESDIREADRQEWDYDSKWGEAHAEVTTSDLSRANQTLSSAERMVGEAKSLLKRHEFSSAQRKAKEARSEAGQASSLAEQEVREAKSEYDSELREVKSKEEDAARTEREISSARGEVDSAERAVSKAKGEDWSYRSSFGNVSVSVNSGDLSSANSALSSAESELRSAKNNLERGNFSQARSDADSAERYASKAKSAASDAIRSAESRFEKEKDQVQAKEKEAERKAEAERQAKREAERKAAAERSSNSSSGSSSGPSGGPSGGTGGGADGRGGSGSRRGRW